MSFEITNTPSASAPEGIEDGLAPAKFLGLAKINHPDWATEKDSLSGKPDNGDRIHWRFVLTDDDGEELYNDGDPIELDVANSTNFNTKSDKSKNAAWLKAVSPQAFALVDAGQPVDPASLEGTPVMLLLEMKDNGWPKIVNVLPAKKRAARRAAPAIAEED